MSDDTNTTPAEPSTAAPASFRDQLKAGAREVGKMHEDGKTGWVDRALAVCLAARDALPDDDRIFVEELAAAREAKQPRAFRDVRAVNRLAHISEHAMAVYKSHGVSVSHGGPRLPHVQAALAARS